MRSKINAAVVFLGALAIGVLLLAPRATAQTMLGNVLSSSITSADCPTLQTDRGFDSTYMANPNCYEAELSGCPGTDDIYFYYGIAPPVGKPQGTIVMLPGDGGVMIPASFADYVGPYVSAGYQVIEVVWAGTTGHQGYMSPADWEYVNTLGGANTLNILTAGCRPSSLLNWIRNGSNTGQVGKGLWGTYGGGMCAHGNSGGAGAIGYALAWYSAGAGGAATWGGGYLDKVVMENGPVFSDIEQGCEVTNGVNSQYTYICAGSGYGTTEPGCGPTWPAGSNATNYHLEYIDGDQSSLSEWTQASTSLSAPACASSLSGSTTPGAQNSAWYSMSIVNTTAGTPSFNYPNTAISGWLCDYVINTPPAENNSAPQGQLFFQQFTSLSQTAGLSVNAAQSCPSNENVENSIIYYDGTYYGAPGPGQAAPWALINDMTTGTTSCVSNKRQ